MFLCFRPVILDAYIIANISPDEKSKHIAESLTCGVYCGIVEFIGKVPETPSAKYKGFMSIGWCPYFENNEKSYVF